LLIAVSVVVLDQITKMLIIARLNNGESISVIGDFLYFQFVYNEGGAMGTRIGPSWLYTILSIAALVMITKYLFSEKVTRMSVGISLALISAGAIGNLIDRFRFGKVVDFIDVDFPDIPFLNLYRWFTFNIADAAITVGLVIFVLALIFKDKVIDNQDSPTSVVGNTDTDDGRSDTQT